MSDQTGIEWADSTFNPWMGCTKVSPACDHCYAERSTPSRRFGLKWGAGNERRRTAKDNWDKVERWNAQRFMQCGECGWRGECDAELIGCGACGSTSQMNDARRRVFCASLADWLDNEVPIEWLVDLLDLIRRTPNLDWLLLTKRVGNFERRVRQEAMFHVIHTQPNRELESWLYGFCWGSPPPNVWLGATVVNQDEADRDIPKLLSVPAQVRFLSIEPMLGPINLTDIEMPESGHGHHELSPIITGNPLKRADYKAAHVHWVICGGESGPQARPMHPDWVRALRDQCAAAGVPFLFKQWGEWAPTEGDTVQVTRIGKKAAGRQLDGRTHDGFPGGAP